MIPQFTIPCHMEDTPLKCLEATITPPRGVFFFCIVTPSGKQWFVPIMTDAYRQF